MSSRLLREQLRLSHESFAITTNATRKKKGKLAVKSGLSQLRSGVKGTTGAKKLASIPHRTSKRQTKRKKQTKKLSIAEIREQRRKETEAVVAQVAREAHEDHTERNIKHLSQMKAKTEAHSHLMERLLGD